MKRFAILGILLPAAWCTERISSDVSFRLYPADGQKDVNPDTHLVLEFSAPPIVGSEGKIYIHDVVDRKLVDTLDLSVPTSPSPYGNGSTNANYTDKTTYQTNVIGGMDFYFYPIIVRENVATVHLHNGRLDYGRTYTVHMDPVVLRVNGQNFTGSASNLTWTFSTKSDGRAHSTTQVVVAADGSADFNTVQGAIDWAPSNPAKRTVILIRDGNYEELVFFQHKTNLVIRGESRNGTVVGYPNNSAFNPPNRQGPSRRPAFSFRGVADLQLSSFTINNYYRGQAEALLVDGARVILDHMTLRGSGDALTTYGTVYITDSRLTGDGDTVLGYASAYWARSEVVTVGGPTTWTRTAQGIHGNVFVNCSIISLRGNATFARLPDNKGGVLPNWPYAEMVLINTKTDGIAPEGWGPVQGSPFDASHVRFWEFNTTDLQGNKVDMSRRYNVSRELSLPADMDILSSYSDPAFVLGGWTPSVS